MKTTGTIWNEYLASWPDGQWFDDSDITFDGEHDVNPVPDTAVVEFSCGAVFVDDQDRDGISLTRHFSKWLKTRDSVTFVVSIPKNAEAEFRKAVKALKGSLR